MARKDSSTARRSLGKGSTEGSQRRPQQKDQIMNHVQTHLKYWMQGLVRPLFQIAVLLASATYALHAYAGTISYGAIPASDSDANSGISTTTQYTSAVDGGNAGGTDRVV